MDNGSRLKSFLFWLLTTFCFVIIPAILLFAGVSRYCHLHENTLKDELKVSFQKLLNSCIRNNDPSSYWGRTLSQRFNEFNENDATIEQIIDWLAGTREKTREKLNYIVWGRSGEIVEKSFAIESDSEALRHTFTEIAGLNFRNNAPRFHKNRSADLKKVREFLGPQYLSKMLEEAVREKSYSLVFSDSANAKPAIWAYRTKRAVVLLFFPSEIMKDMTGVLSAIEGFEKESNLKSGLYNRLKKQIVSWRGADRENSVSLIEHIEIAEDKVSNLLETDDYYLATGYLSRDYRVFSHVNKYFNSFSTFVFSTAAAIIWILLMLPFLKYTWKTICLGQPGTISIRPRIAFVFFFATAIPFLVMSVFAREHYSQKHETSLKEIYQRSLSLIQNYDIRMQSMVSRLEFNMKNFLVSWVSGMEGKMLTEQSIESMKIRNQELNAGTFFLVASSSHMVGTKHGLIECSESLDEKKIKSGKGDLNSGDGNKKDKDGSEANIVNIIGKRIMNELNGLSTTSKDSGRMEILFESILQKSFAEITHSFIKAMGGISPWGFGLSSNLALLDFLRVNDFGKIDYMAMVIWNGPTIQANYIETTIIDVNKNPLGLRVFARSNIEQSEIFPPDFKVDTELNEFIKRVTDQPTEEIEIINFENEPHMAIGFTGKQLSRYHLVGLFPLRLIDANVSRQRGDLILLVIFCLIVTAWLAQLLSQSFLIPLKGIYDAALAVEKRNFSYRIAAEGKDEFGEVAGIFNNVLISLEELEIAKVVQESLFPVQTLEAGGFKIYGKSLAMAELGGDYFDYFPIDDEHVAALMGDVAGHGVGAALIMAMAKAGVISSSPLLSQPAKLLERLHGLIYGSKTRKQKKIMTFQYLAAQNNTGRIFYSNAGGCSPILVRKNGDTSEITLQGAALGAFKKAKFSELELELSSGDMIVFYTDGIIEARDANDIEMGYEGFAKLVRESVDSDPAAAYEKICAGYMKHIAGQDAQDDLTMVVICYN